MSAYSFRILRATVGTASVIAIISNVQMMWFGGSLPLRRNHNSSRSLNHGRLFFFTASSQCNRSDDSSQNE